MIILTLKDLTESFKAELEKMKQNMTERKLAEWICVGAVSAAVTGILFAYKSGKRIREAQINDAEHAAVTIKLHDVDTIRIERVE